MAHLWKCKLSSFSEFAIGAKHWYVKLESGYDTICIDRVLTKLEAIKLTEDDSGDFRIVHRAGDHTNRFQSRQEAINAALSVWSSFKTSDDALISTGDKWNLPYRLDVLEGPSEFVRRTRSLVLLGERESRGSRIRECDKAWEDLLVEFNLVEAREWEDRAERTALINRNKTVSLLRGAHPRWSV